MPFVWLGVIILVRVRGGFIFGFTLVGGVVGNWRRPYPLLICGVYISLIQMIFSDPKLN